MKIIKSQIPNNSVNTLIWKEQNQSFSFIKHFNHCIVKNTWTTLDYKFHVINFSATFLQTFLRTFRTRRTVNRLLGEGPCGIAGQRDHLQQLIQGRLKITTQHRGFDHPRLTSFFGRGVFFFFFLFLVSNVLFFSGFFAIFVFSEVCPTFFWDLKIPPQKLTRIQIRGAIESFLFRPKAAERC